eukprot:4274007-Pyramimonas_sp.AAC.1
MRCRCYYDFLLLFVCTSSLVSAAVWGEIVEVSSATKIEDAVASLLASSYAVKQNDDNETSLELLILEHEGDEDETTTSDFNNSIVAVVDSNEDENVEDHVATNNTVPEQEVTSGSDEVLLSTPLFQRIDSLTTEVETLRAQLEEKDRTLELQALSFHTTVQRVDDLTAETEALRAQRAGIIAGI